MWVARGLCTEYWQHASQLDVNNSLCFSFCIRACPAGLLLVLQLPVLMAVQGSRLPHPLPFRAAAGSAPGAKKVCCLSMDIEVPAVLLGLPPAPTAHVPEPCLQSRD